MIINAILVEPKKYAQRTQICTDSMCLKLTLDTQMYEQIYPFANKEICVIISECRNTEGLPFNRAIFKNDGETIKEVLAGKFIVAGTTEHSLRSLTPEEENEIMSLLYLPHKFFFDNGDLIAFQYKPKETGEEQSDIVGKYAPQELEQSEEYHKRKRRMHKALQELLSELPPHLNDNLDELIEAATSVFAFEKKVYFERGISFAKDLYLWATQ